MTTFNEPPEYAQARKYAKQRLSERKMTQLAAVTGCSYASLRNLAIGRTTHPSYTIVQALLKDEKLNKRRGKKAV
mgnify:FL=1